MNYLFGSERLTKLVGWTILWLGLVYAAIGAYGAFRDSSLPLNDDCIRAKHGEETHWHCHSPQGERDLKDVKVMCWNQLTQSPRECK